MMLQNKVIFILSLMKFDGLASTNFTVAKYLARHNEVYYLEQPFTLKDYMQLDKKSEKYIRRKEGMNLLSNGLLSEKVDGVNVVISYPVLPIAFLPKGRLYDSLLYINESLILNRIKRIIKEKSIKEYIFINSYNFHFPNIGKRLSPALSVYHCVDPIVGEYDSRHGVEAENKIVAGSDVVVCTSKALFLEKRRINNNTYFVPNASDLVDTLQANKDFSIHNTVSHIPRPIAGYVGAIERRLDFELLKKVTEENKHISFVFVGPVYHEHVPGWFFQQNNIYVIPPIPYSEVPDMIYSFDVCLIPFKKDNDSKSIFPLKLFEYLGLGKPVIVTDFNNDLKDYTAETVSYVHDVHTFSYALIEALHNSQSLLAERLEIARKNTWKVRVDNISDILLQTLSG